MADLKGKYDRSTIPELDLGRTHSVDRQDTEQRTRYPWEEEGKIIARPLSRGKGKLLNDNLRRLPSEYLAKELEDPERIHELDPDHIRGALAQEMYDEQSGFAGNAFGTGDKDGPEDAEVRHIPVNDMTISILKLRVLSALLGRAQTAHERRDFVRFNEAMATHHLWFPENDLNVRELRKGNPPADTARPDFLKGLDLVVAPRDGIPQRCLDVIQNDRRRREAFVDHFDEKVLEAAMAMVNARSFQPILVPR